MDKPFAGAQCSNCLWWEPAEDGTEGDCCVHPPTVHVLQDSGDVIFVRPCTDADARACSLFRPKQ